MMRRAPWDPHTSFDWATIKEEWHSYWDPQKPIFLEKSPPNILRASEISKHFQPRQFILMVWNPYAHAEGLRRRNGWTINQAARFALRCLRIQRQNRESLDPVVLRYEDLTEDPASTVRRLQNAIHELGSLDPHRSFTTRSIDGRQENRIQNYNRKKLLNLTSREIAQMTKIFEAEPDLLRYWQYDFVKPGLRHDLLHYSRSARSLCAGWYLSTHQFVKGTVRRMTRAGA